MAVNTQFGRSILRYLPPGAALSEAVSNASAQLFNVFVSEVVLQGIADVLLLRVDATVTIPYRRPNPIRLAIKEKVMLLRRLRLGNTKALERLNKAASMEGVVPPGPTPE